jgi:hypothetical protein
MPGGRTSTIGPQQTINLPRLDRKGEVVDGSEITEALDQVGYVNGGLGHVRTALVELEYCQFIPYPT